MASAVGQTSSLWDALTSIPDHRRAAGKRYPLASLLLIALAAMLAGRRDQLGIVRWGRRLSGETLRAIGIGRERVPAPSVWCELFQDLDITALEQALSGWVIGEAPVIGPCRNRWQAAARQCHGPRPGHASAGGVQRQSARRDWPVAGGTGGQ